MVKVDTKQRIKARIGFCPGVREVYSKVVDGEFEGVSY